MFSTFSLHHQNVRYYAPLRVYSVVLVPQGRLIAYFECHIGCESGRLRGHRSSSKFFMKLLPALEQILCTSER